MLTALTASGSQSLSSNLTTSSFFLPSPTSSTSLDSRSHRIVSELSPLRSANSSIPKICGVGSGACSSKVRPFFSSFFSIHAHRQSCTRTRADLHLLCDMGQWSLTGLLCYLFTRIARLSVYIGHRRSLFL